VEVKSGVRGSGVRGRKQEGKENCDGCFVSPVMNILSEEWDPRRCVI
jgi:hypothetical protein